MEEAIKGEEKESKDKETEDVEEFETVSKKKFYETIILAVLITTAVFLVGGYFIFETTKNKLPEPESRRGADQIQTQPEKSIEQVGETASRFEAAPSNQGVTNPNLAGFEKIKKGEVIWQPVSLLQNQVDSIENRSFETFKIGQINKGVYQGSEVHMAYYKEECPGNCNTIYRFLKKDGKITFTANVNNDFVLKEKWQKEQLDIFLRDLFGNAEANPTFNEKLVFEELITPDEFFSRTPGEKFKRNIYDLGFFDNSKLKVAFKDYNLGQIWTTDLNKIDSEDVSIFSSEGFFLALPDGTFVSYRYFPEIFAEGADSRYFLLKATWDNGQKNQATYEINPGGCGKTSYVYNKTGIVDISNDLESIGKAENGDNLYGFKNINHSEFKKLYDIYWVDESAGKVKKAPMNFLEIQPMVFWQDPFGRLLAFYRSDILSPAECGKPVIYLYPEEPMEISVKVRLENGFSITDPIYNGGWKVIAKPNGELTNLADSKNYPYLFWEGQGNISYQKPEEGFVVQYNKLGVFFDDKLALLGLNRKEIDDFKEFWLPVMQEENKPYYFVTFLPQNFIDRLAPLEIEPSPDKVIRVLMDYEGLDYYQETPKLEISTPRREGFTAVEWGGMLKGKTQ